MQGKGVVKFFAILLGLVCLYMLSFTWVVQKVKNDAKTYAKGDTTKEKAYLDSMSNRPVYPVFGHTFQYCQSHELALGLDLQGGMSVTMQVSLVELVKTLSNNNPDVVFNQALKQADLEDREGKSQSDYITLFVNDYEKLNPNGKLAAIFATKDNQSDLKFNDDNAKVEAYLKKQADVAVQNTYTVINTRIDQFGVTQPNVQLLKDKNQILIELPGVTEPERVRKLLQGTAELEFYNTFDNQQAFATLNSINTFLAAKAKSAKDTTKTAAAKADTGKKANKLAGNKTDTASKGALSLLNKVNKTAKNDTSAAALAGKAQAMAQNPLFALLAPMGGQQGLYPGPVVGHAAKKDTAKINNFFKSPDVKALIPQNMRFLWSVKAVNASDPDAKDKIFELYAMKLSGADNTAALSGEVVTDARSDIDQMKGGYEVTMYMSSAGAQKWKEITAAAAPKHEAIAIVLDNNVYSAPEVENEIAGGISSISGHFTQEETTDLANVLKAGRLPAPALIVSEATVGATLGQQAIDASLLSCVLGFIVVLIFMVAYYNRAGTVAVIAVLFNVFFLMGILISMNAVLTVPGVAGIVLTLGISVDANVLIYERMREELAAGKSIKLAVTDGFKHALSSILDANISTFITGLILLIFGSGPIRGFAVVLLIGIVTSLFCSLLISRIIFEWMITKGWDIKVSNPWSSHTFKNANYAFVKNRFKFYIFSTVFIVAGLISMFTQGFNYGVDFVGGRNYIVHFDNPNVTTEMIHNAIDKPLGASEVKTFGTHEISITTKYHIEESTTAADAEVRTALIKALSTNAETKIDGKNIVKYQKVKATIAEGLKQSAFWTIFIAIIAISGYILIRFRKWQFSLGAMIATAHDALMVLSFFSLFKSVPFLPFLDIDQSFIAAILTVIGYSINDTVVVFDRIREFLHLHHSASDDPKEVINHAINKTLSRTIITALTVLFVLIVLFIFGGDVIRGFSFALLVGVCFGTYSSICIATPVIIDFGKKDLK